MWSESEESGDEFERTKDRKCTYCGETLTSCSEIPVHMTKCTIAKMYHFPKLKLKNGIEKFICDICCSGYKFLQKLKEHLRKHEPPGGFFCIYCEDEISFCSKFALEKHLENSHSIYKCSTCSDIFKSANDFTNHKRDFHAEDQAKIIICEFCFHPFKTYNQLDYHVERNCGQNKRFKCSDCSETFQTNGALKEHKLSHFNVNLKETPNKKSQCKAKSKRSRKPRSKTIQNKPSNGEVILPKSNKNSQIINETSQRKSLRIKKEIHYDESNDFEDTNNILTSQIPDTIKIEPELLSQPEINCEDNTSAFYNSTNQEDLIKNEMSDSDQNQYNNFNAESSSDDDDDDDDQSSSESESEPTPKGKRKAPASQQNKRKKTMNETDTNSSNEKCAIIKKSFECIFCADSVVKFGKMSTYTKHLHKEHKKNNEEVLAILKEIDSVNLNLFCKICGKYYKTIRTLKNHEERHGPHGDLTVYCTCCKVYLPSTTDLEKHMVELHIDRVKCKICGKQYKNYESLHMHMSNHHENKVKKRSKKTYICNKCGKTISSKRQLDDHEASDCGKNPTYQCKICGKCLTTAGILKSHLRTHSKDNLHHCKFCGKGFAAKGNLDRHERSHTGERPYPCTYCDKAFAYQENLFIHLSTHTGMKRYMCVTCSERFSCISGLKCHWKTNATTCGADPNRSTKAVGEYIGFRKGKIVHEKE